VRKLIGSLLILAGIYAIVFIAVSDLTRDDNKPHSVGQPAALLAPAGSALLGPNGPAGPTGVSGCAFSFTVPGKAWGGRFHWSPAILKPTKLEHVCVSYPGRGTLATVKVTAP
jgi:hypothetical protein